MSADPEIVRPTRPDPAKDAESKPAALAAGSEASARKESTRPWAIPRAVGPSWAEKIEEF